MKSPTDRSAPLRRATLAALLGLAAVLPASAQRAERLINLSSRSAVGPGRSELVAGFVLAGPGPQTILLRGIGPALAAFGVGDAVVSPRLRLYDGQGKFLREVSGWSGDTTLPATFARVGAFPLAPGSADSAFVATLAPGGYSVQLISPATTTGTALVEIYDTETEPPATAARLINLSTRGEVGAGNQPLIGGFVVTGAAPKQVLIRGVGPALAAFGLGNLLADPRLRLYRGTTLVAENDNTGDVPAEATALAAAARASGAFALPAGGKDAALLLTLAPGAYTVHISAASGPAAGTAMVEIYEVP